MREKVCWYLDYLADTAQDIAFSRKHKIWRWIFVSIANRIDGITLHVMTEEMRNRPAKAAPSNAEIMRGEAVPLD